jgi:hypothetical protein
VIGCEKLPADAVQIPFAVQDPDSKMLTRVKSWYIVAVRFPKQSADFEPYHVLLYRGR